MAKLDRPDYSFQGQVPTAAIIQAYQQKALAEQKSRDEAAAAKEQKWVDTAKIVQSGADMINKFTSDAKAKAQEDAYKSAQLWVGKQNEVDPTTGTTYGESAQFNPTLEAFMAKAAPEEYKKEKIKSMLEMQNPRTNSTAEARKTGIRDMLVQMPDGTEANKMIGFDAEGAYNPLNGKRVLSPDDYSALPERSYAMQGVEDSEGNVNFVPKSRTGKVNTGGVGVPEKERGKISDINLLPKKQAADANLRLKDAMEDPVIKNAKTTAVTISNVEKMLSSNNKIAIDRLGGLTQKLVALDSGNLAAWEQRDPNSRAAYDRLMQFIKMNAKGELTDKNKAEFADLLKVTKDNLLVNMEDAADQRISGLVETYPRLNKDAMKKKLGLDVYKKRLGSATRTSPGGHSYSVE